MKEGILSIDLSSEPARLVVAHVEGGSLQIAQQREVALDFVAHKLLIPVPPSNPNPEDSKDNKSNPVSPSTDLAALASKLRAAVSALSVPWYGTVLVIPGSEYLALNLELPFSGQKQIAKIIDLEVQDLVPFDIADFVLDHGLVHTLAVDRFDIHVGMLPRVEMRQVTEFCKLAEIDPLCICVPAGALGAAFQLAPHYFAQNSALVWAEEPNYAVAIAVDGKVRTTRVIGSSVEHASGSPAWKRSIIQEFRLTIASAERRYSTTLDKVYLFGTSLRDAEFQNGLGRQVIAVTPNEFVRGESISASLAPFAALCGNGLRSPVSSNFRRGEFAFRPQFGALLTGLKSLIPLGVGCLLLAFITLCGIYLLRSSQASRLEALMHERIYEVIPTLKLQLGQELAAVRAEIESLEKKLKELGSISKLSALDALLEISKDIPPIKDMSIFKVTIKEDKVTVHGAVESYASLDNLEKALKAKTGTYCNVEVKQDRGSSISKDFELVIRTC